MVTHILWRWPDRLQTDFRSSSERNMERLNAAAGKWVWGRSAAAPWGRKSIQLWVWQLIKSLSMSPHRQMKAGASSSSLILTCCFISVEMKMRARPAACVVALMSSGGCGIWAQLLNLSEPLWRMKAVMLLRSDEISEVLDKWSSDLTPSGSGSASPLVTVSQGMGSFSLRGA